MNQAVPQNGGLIINLIEVYSSPQTVLLVDDFALKILKTQNFSLSYMTQK
jgi:hypothetical protein